MQPFAPGDRVAMCVAALDAKVGGGFQSESDLAGTAYLLRAIYRKWAKGNRLLGMLPDLRDYLLSKVLAILKKQRGIKWLLTVNSFFQLFSANSVSKQTRKKSLDCQD